MACLNTSPSCPGLRVLVADNDVDFTCSTALILHHFGHLAHMAFDGPTTLEKVRTCSPDVVLLHHALPILDGWEVARRLKDDYRISPPPLLIAVSGPNRPESQSRALEGAVDLLLPKPINFGHLLAVLERFQRLTRSD